MQGVQFPLQNLQGVLAVLQDAGGFHLSHNAARLLAAVDGAVIDTAFHIAGLAACNAAHVIADVGITDGAAVDAAPDHTGRGTRHAADVGNIVGLFGVQQVLQLEIPQVHLILADGGVDAAVVGTAGNHTVVLPRKAAHKVVAVDVAPDGTAGNHASDDVGSRDAAHPAGA